MLLVSELTTQMLCKLLAPFLSPSLRANPCLRTAQQVIRSTIHQSELWCEQADQFPHAGVLLLQAALAFGP